MAKKRKQSALPTAIKLSERAMLASLHTGMWSGMAVDREVSEEVSENHKAERDSGHYKKRLISSKFLSHVGSKLDVARRTHRILTLPWEDDGTRILSNTGYLHYTESMRLHQHAVKAATHEFINSLPVYIEEARTRLGTMFNKEDYPSAKDLPDKFYIDVEIKPIPTGSDFRAKLTDDAMKAITQDIEDRCNERIEAAITDVYQRVADVTSRMAERLRGYEPGESTGVIRDTVVYNISELADLIPSLNITGDPKLDALAKQLKDDLVEHSPEVLRADAKARKRTADAAERILNKVNTFLA